MIGTLDTYVEIERPITSKNRLNEEETTWELVEAVWVSKRLKNASEGISDDQLSSKYLYQLKTHYLPDIKDDYRINIEGELFNIIGHESPFRSKTIITVEQTSYERRV
jgi:head-tail adaptor